VDEEETANDASRELELFNAGIAKVTPIQAVHDVINGETFMKQREENERKHREKNAETLDSVPPPKARPEGALTQEGFEEALRRASRKVEDKEETK
jgi:hypothetical protein